jgi:nucleoside-diphosphate-sugar epimerase
MPLTVCVTGAAGMTGAACVAELLEHGYRVLATDIAARPASLPTHPDLTFTRADLTDYGDTVDILAGVDAVVHMANIPAPGLVTSARTFTVNTAMNSNVFLAAAALKLRRVVWASSETTLGLEFNDRAPLYVPLDEDHFPYPTTTYALSKVVGETLAEHISGWSGIPFVGLRLSNVIRPEVYAEFPTFWDDPRKRLFNLWCYIDVRDAAAAARLGLEADVTGSSNYIIAAPDTVMTTPSAELIESVYPGTTTTHPLSGFEALMSSERAHQALGFVAKHTWRDHVRG